MQFDYFTNVKNLGLRANEPFLLNNWNFVDNTYFTLKPQKGNDTRIFLPIELSEYFRSSIINKVSNYYPFSYSQFNMYFKRFSTQPFIYCDNRNESVNILRHYKAKTMKNEGKTDIEIATYFGERDLKNMRGYIYSDLYVI